MANLLLSLPGSVSGSAGCVDEAGKPVSWWFLYKHPRWSDKSHKNCIGDCTGSKYVYQTSETISSQSWLQGSAPVTSPDSLLGVQLAAIYDNSLPNYVFYNDRAWHCFDPNLHVPSVCMPPRLLTRQRDTSCARRTPKWHVVVGLWTQQRLLWL